MIWENMIVAAAPGSNLARAIHRRRGGSPAMTEHDTLRRAGGGIVGTPPAGRASRRSTSAGSTHHPVPLVPSALVAVSGTGPGRDSNGSGKTTFLAAVSMLLGDPEWRIATTGGADALGLLFDPDLSGDAAGLYDPARVGYVAGVFAHVTADGHYDDLTVWVRVSADDSPRLAARWAPGVHLVADRNDAVTTWNCLGRERQLGPTAFVEQLYGGTGRCLAYVTSRGNRDTDTSLMQLQARLSPSRIGSELIVLLGLEHLIEGERDLRAKLADAQQRLATRIDEHERREREWAATLAEIDARDGARAGASSEGQQLWQLRIARKLLDARRRARAVRRRRSPSSTCQCRSATSQPSGTSRPGSTPCPTSRARRGGRRAAERRSDGAAERRHQAATQDVGRRELELEQLVDADHRANEQGARCAGRDLDVDDAEQRPLRPRRRSTTPSRRSGRGRQRVRGRAATSLRSPSTARPTRPRALHWTPLRFEATALIDGIVLDENARQRWEPLLAPWRDAFVVPRRRSVTAPSRRRRLARSSSSPTTSPSSGPDGVLAAPAGTARFLDALLDRSRSPYTDAVAGVVVAGGFEHELCGRDAAIDRARAELERRRTGGRPRHGATSGRSTATSVAVDAVDRVRAADELAGLRSRGGRGRPERWPSARRALAEAEARRTQPTRRFVDARGAAGRPPHRARPPRRATLEVAQSEANGSGSDDRDRDDRSAIGRLDVDGWRRAWGGTDDDRGRRARRRRPPGGHAAQARHRAARRRPGADRHRLDHRRGRADSLDRRGDPGSARPRRRCAADERGPSVRHRRPAARRLARRPARARRDLPPGRRERTGAVGRAHRCGRSGVRHPERSARSPPRHGRAADRGRPRAGQHPVRRARCRRRRLRRAAPLAVDPAGASRPTCGCGR